MNSPRTDASRRADSDALNDRSTPLASAMANFEQIPPRPTADLDSALDATERCLARYGIRRTTMTDIAKELGVSRPTLYRQLSSLEEAIALAGSRQFHRFLDELAGLVTSAVGPDTFIDATIYAVTFALDYPVAVRILNDEPDLVGEMVTTGQLPHFAEQVVTVLTPIFEAAMAAGSIRQGDPRLAAGLMVRLVAALVAIPAHDSLEQQVRFVLEPVLLPTDASGMQPRNRRAI